MSLSKITCSTSSGKIFLFSSLTLALIGCDQNSTSPQANSSTKTTSASPSIVAGSTVKEAIPEHDVNQAQNPVIDQGTSTLSGTRAKIMALSSADTASITPHIQGAWSAPMNWPVIAAHAEVASKNWTER